ncbi:MAG: Ldh family oxidoreductase [Actinobacteria bacterium]|nr:Ldh family oxidoreductase [Actinomycetota bacterium]
MAPPATQDNDGPKLISVGHDEAQQAGEAILAKHGVGRSAAALQTSHLVEGDLRGRPSHGMQRLPTLIERIESGVLDPEAELQTSWTSDAFLAIDGHDGFGTVAIEAAIELLSDRAGRTGVAMAGVRRASHIGMLAPYLERICERGMVGIVMTTSEALVHPTGGRTALLGTNPIGVGVPADPEPFVLDMSTGSISAGEVIASAQRGESLPPGRCIDAAGNPTTVPERAQDGAISPFGGGKGYGLSLAIELLVALLSRTALGVEVRGTLDGHHPVTKGDAVIVIDPAVVGAPSPASYLSAYLEELRVAPTAPGYDSVLIPGDRMRSERERRLRAGIPLPAALWQELLRLRDEKMAGAE